jgi:hypothetical protein
MAWKRPTGQNNQTPARKNIRPGYGGVNPSSAKPGKILRRQNEITRSQRGNNRRQKRRRQPRNSPQVKPAKRPIPTAQIAGDHARDQKPRYYEENIDADETAFSGPEPGVKKQNKQDRHSAQAVYGFIIPVFGH